MAPKGSLRQWQEELGAAKARIAELEAQLANQQRATVEMTLHESEPRYRLLMQSIPVPLGVANTNGDRLPGRTDGYAMSDTKECA